MLASKPCSAHELGSERESKGHRADMWTLSTRSAFTFDNVMTFPCGIDFKTLKRMGCVNAANLVTAQRISHESLVRIACKGFEASSG